MNGETIVEQIQIIDSKNHVGETVKIGLGSPINVQAERLPFYNYVMEQLIFKEL